MNPREAARNDWFRSGLFGLVAPALGWAPPLRYLLRRRRVLRLLTSQGPCRLVEVGSGAGALLDELALLGHDAIGMETSARALALARDIAVATGGRQVLVASPDPAWRENIDMVCAFDVLEHIEDDAAALDHWLSWLRPGGRICLSVPAHRRRWGAGDEWAGHYRRYDRADVLGLLGSRGLIVEHFECYGFPLANLTEWLGNRTYRHLMQARNKAWSSAEASAESGIERRDYLRLFRRMDTFAGRLALRGCFWLQAVSARTDLGSGYLVLARRA